MGLEVTWSGVLGHLERVRSLPRTELEVIQSGTPDFFKWALKSCGEVTNFLGVGLDLPRSGCQFILIKPHAQQENGLRSPRVWHQIPRRGALVNTPWVPAHLVWCLSSPGARLDITQQVACAHSEKGLCSGAKLVAIHSSVWAHTNWTSRLPTVRGEGFCIPKFSMSSLDSGLKVNQSSHKLILRRA